MRFIHVGLAAYIFTTNVQRSWRVSEALEYGLVGVNEGLISTEVSYLKCDFHLILKDNVGFL